jgi:hypothetical protein
MHLPQSDVVIVSHGAEEEVRVKRTAGLTTMTVVLRDSDFESSPERLRRIVAETKPKLLIRR